MNLVRTASQMHLQDMKAHRETGTWKRQLFEGELSEAARLAHARVAVLVVRVRDEAVRNLVADIKPGHDRVDTRSDARRCNGGIGEHDDCL